MVYAVPRFLWMEERGKHGLPVITNNVVIFEFIPNKISVSRLSPIMIVLSGSKWCLSPARQIQVSTTRPGGGGNGKTYAAMMVSIICLCGLPMIVGVFLVEYRRGADIAPEPVRQPRIR